MPCNKKDYVVIPNSKIQLIHVNRVVNHHKDKKPYYQSQDTMIQEKWQNDSSDTFLQEYEPKK